MRRGRVLAAAAGFGVLAVAGAAAAVAISNSTGTVSVCASATVPPQTVQLNGSDIATVPAASDSQCATTTYTVPTETATVTTTQTETDVTTATVTQTATETTTQTVTTTPPPLVAANIFVAASGSSGCARSAAAVPFGQAAGSTCQTFQQAYKVAQCGDTVLVEPGAYPAQEVDRGTDKACGAHSCDQFQAHSGMPPAGTTGGCVTIAPDVSASGLWSIAGFWSNANYLRLDGLGVLTDTGGLTFYAKSAAQFGTADSCNAAYGHDDIAQNIAVDGRFDGINGHGTFALIGTHNVSLIRDSVGNALTSGSDGSSSQWNDCKQTTTFSQSANNMLAGSTIHDFVETIGATGHVECIHDDVATGPATIISNRFENCNQQNISAQTLTASDVVTGLHIENNYFDYPASHAAAMGYKVQQIGNVLLICRYAGGTFVDFEFRNNSFYNQNGKYGGPTLQEDAGSNTCTWTGGVVTGNILNAIGASCAHAGTVAANLYLLPSVTGCGRDTAYGSTSTPYLDPANYIFDLDPAKAGLAYGLVPSVVGYPLQSINGVARPDPADAGAFQH